MTVDIPKLAHDAGTSVSAVCRTLGCSKSGVYARRKREIGPRALDTARLDVEIAAVHKEHRGIYGSPRVHAALRGNGNC